MTERLSALLRDEASALDVPPPPAALVVTRGQTLQRRKRLGTAVAGVVLVTAVVTGAAYAANGRDDGSHAVDPAGPSTGHGAVFTVGTTVYFDGGTQHVSIDDKAVKSSYYTSAGLLVRHGNNNSSDGGGPQRFSLVTPDGTVKPVSVVTEEIVPGVDPTQPYLAYTEVVDGVVQVVVHDVSTDEEVARIDLPGDLTWGGWSGPPVALSGDTVYVGTDDATHTVDWRTGEIGVSDVLGPGYPDVDGGRTIQQDKGTATVLDVATGEELLTIDAGRFGYAVLSPDGHFLTLDGQDGESFDVYAVDSGTKVTFPGGSFDYGWTPDGDLVRIKHQHVETCSTTDGECSTGTETIPEDGGGVAPTDVRFAGQTFES